ncbi:MAG TPA: putative glycolipid-binding domain-containing protein [Thermoplasmata archaeon]|nr:putative glycolipid-binding domain-containing protein [Thermoplasmata archaeon]
MSPPRVLGRAQWRYFRHPGIERAILSRTDHGFHLSGRARLRFPEGPTTVTYAIACDLAWAPRSAQVDLRQRRQRHFLHVEISEEGMWTIDGFCHRELAGFTDFDLSASPATNTLALKRLDLPVGGAAEIRTGWVVFPDLEVRAVTERYARVSESHYVYERLHNGFRAEFDVDRKGFVLHYPEFWERMPFSGPPRKRGAAKARRRRA